MKLIVDLPGNAAQLSGADEIAAFLATQSVFKFARGGAEAARYVAALIDTAPNARRIDGIATAQGVRAILTTLQGAPSRAQPLLTSRFRWRGEIVAATRIASDVGLGYAFDEQSRAYVFVAFLWNADARVYRFQVRYVEAVSDGDGGWEYDDVTESRNFVWLRGRHDAMRALIDAEILYDTAESTLEIEDDFSSDSPRYIFRRKDTGRPILELVLARETDDDDERS